MEEAKQGRALNLIDDGDAAAVRFLTEADDAAVSRALSGDVPHERLLSAVNRYEHLSPTYRTKYLRALEDADAGTSWLRTSGATVMSKPDIRRALDRVDEMQAAGHDLRKFHTASELNNDIAGKPPYKEGTIVVDFDIHGTKTLWRVYDSQDVPQGPWLFKRALLDDVSTKEELIDKLGLLPEEWDVTYNKVVRLDTGSVDSSTKTTLRVSTAGDLASDTSGEIRDGGATQFKLVGENVEDGWKKEGPLEDYLD